MLLRRVKIPIDVCEPISTRLTWEFLQMSVNWLLLNLIGLEISCRKKFLLDGPQRNWMMYVQCYVFFFLLLLFFHLLEECKLYIMEGMIQITWTCHDIMLIYVSLPTLGTGSKQNNGCSPLDTNRASLAPQCTVYPWHATQVSLPEQRFRTHMIPASMT